VTNLPDVTDPTIRAMVLRDHEPEETWSAEGRLLSVHCRTCYQHWPCPAHKAAWEAERVAMREVLDRGRLESDDPISDRKRRRRRWFGG
jgi:hypothetical protein